MIFSLTAGADDSGRRLDRILRKALRDMPLSAIHRLLRQGRVLVDGKAAGAGRLIREGETITLPGTATPGRGPQVLEGEKFLTPGTSALPEILFDGKGLLVFNKPAGLPVHGRGSLDELACSYLIPRLPPSLSFRPGPLHRLDRPSSGIIAFSASIEGARLFSALMRERKVKKRYLALVEGVVVKAEAWQDELFRDGGRKKTMIGASGKTAVTRVTPLAENGVSTLILADIDTGRTHQIRAQAAVRGHPLLGDRKYGARTSGGGFLLHAWRMEFSRGSPFPPLIEAPLPENFQRKIQEFYGTPCL